MRLKEVLMDPSTTSEIRDTFIAVSLFAAAAMGWYILYVGPSDAVRDAVMDCMADRGDLHSRDAYDACMADLRGEG